MKKTVIICRDPYDQTTWTTEQVHDVCAYLKQQFKVFPEFAKIYHGSVAESQDVTPRSEADIKKLQQLEGTLYVVVYGAYDPFTIVYLAVMAIIAITSIYMIATMPKPPNQQQGSSNNELQGRSNKARLKGRIPDIYGTVRSYPDLIAVPYTYYEGGIEVEECLMVIGRGHYQIHDFRDGDTPTGAISESSVSVYNPNTPITGDTAFYRIGQIFNNLPLSIKKSESINGQSLKPPSDTVISDEESGAGIYFTTGGVINRKNSAINFTSYFKSGDAITINGAEFGIADAVLSGLATIKSGGIVTVQSNEDITDYDDYKGLLLTGATFEYIVSTTDPETEEVSTESTFRDLSGQYDVISVSRSASEPGYLYTMTLNQPKNVNFNWDFVTQDHTIAAGITLNKSTNGVDLDGAYTVESVTTSTITLTTPSGINSDWLKLPDLLGGTTANLESSIDLDLVSDKWVGWFDVEFDDPTEAIFNFYFPQGLYNMTSKGKVGEGFVEITIQYKYLGESTIHTRQHFEWRNGNKDTFGITIRETLRGMGNGISFRIAKTQQKYGNSPVTECKVKEVFLAVQTQKNSYPDVTVVRTRTVATDGALSVKERKANCLLTRKLPVDGVGPLVTTRDAGQALINMAFDPYIGRRSNNEIDIEQIKAEIEKIKAYFGSNAPAEFNYTLDDAELSFEEQAGMVASACFSECYRYGNKLRMRFEQPQETSVLLFNHRNKVPQSEKRTYSFGIQKDYDGIKLEYTNSDDERVNYYLSYNPVTRAVTEDSTATNPLEITTSGIRNEAVAKTRAWREWNKLQFQRISVDFDALDESELLMRNDRVLVADNTVISTQDGEVVSQNGFTLTLSQNVEFKNGAEYYCFLQLSDGSTQSILCHAGDMTNEIILTEPPRLPLVIDPDRYVKTLYTVVESTETDKQAFMLTEMSPNDQMTNKLTCINYSDRYYEKDHSYI